MTGPESWLERAESKVSSLASSTEHFAKVTGESALHASIQEPIDGFTQLVNHISKPLTGYELPTLHLVDAPPAVKAGSSDWYAEMIGTGIGRAVDYMALAAGLEAVGVTAAAGSALGGLFESPGAAAVATTVGKAALTGAIYGGVLIPAKNENDFWKERVVDGIGWGAGAAAAGLAAAGAVEILDTVGNNIAAEGLSDSVSGQTIKAIVGGTTSGLTKNETYMALGQPDLSPDAVGGRLLRSVTRNMITTAASEIE